MRKTILTTLQANITYLVILESRKRDDRPASLQVHVPHVGDIGAHLALGIASRVNRFGILEGELSEMKLELLEGVALVKKLNKLPIESKRVSGVVHFSNR